MPDVFNQPDGPAWLNCRSVPVDYGGPTDIPYPSLPPRWTEQPIIHHLHAVVDRFADKIAIDDGTTRMTYRQVRAAVDQLGARIVHATPVGGPVLAVLENTSIFPVVFLACLASGRPIIPIDPSYPAAHREAIARECGAVAVILGDGLAWPEGLPDTLPLISAGFSSADEPMALGIEALTVPPAINHTAGVIYTSGSTGRPKGVAFSHRHLLASVAEYVNACHIGEQDRLVALASLSGASGREALAALLTGGTLFISDLRQAGIGGAFRTLINGKVTVIAFVPSVLGGFASRPDAAEAMASLRIVDLFGEKTTPDTVTALRAVLPATCHIRVGLGSTETMSLFHWFVPRDFVSTAPGLPCGYLAENKSIMLVDDAGAPVEPGSAGEVVVRGHHIASGMWRNGSVVPGPFAPDPVDPASRVFHTGDLIRLRADGLAEFVGRRDRRVKIHGVWADPGDVETALHRLPGIADCAVVTHASGEDTVLLAYVVPNGSRMASTQPIRAALRAELPSHLLPAQIHLIDRIPRLPNFKPDLVALARREPADLASDIDPLADQSVR